MNKSENNVYTVTLEECPDTGELLLPFPDELLERMSWGPGDTLVWGNSEAGIFLTKKENADD